ncbi:MAG: Wzz/FepE/Etk N-terminal domain-containing protein [Finegoldia magna]|uniref:YveK family protein n=1 Tax=Finegoldia magna TaxID=1260 RepID=UPI002903186D|nr:Wzz/FepE/Etk N-terminal domain-containing protein [Finegoldia magna]MDU2639448.1 Wzz/FepE/Etk N-terminal domain-containing protein [Finegoldia magna]
MEEISLLELIEGIKRRIKWIILFMILGGLLAFGVSKFLIRPQYEASTTMIIGKPKEYDIKDERSQYNQVMLNQKLVSTYSEIIKSRGIAEQVIKNLQLDFDLEKYQRKVEVEPVKDTELISVKVRDNIPQRAMDIANETAEIFQNDIKTIMQIDNVKILDEAVLPKKPSSPKIKRNTALGALLGLFISSFMAVFIEINDTRIKSAEELQEKFNIPVLGVIPEIKEK